MGSVAIIAEGATDQVVIEYLLEKVVQSSEGVAVNFLQPSRDQTDAFHAPHAGWELVFEYCSTKMVDALVTNDYVIVQIDTDCAPHANFGVALLNNGNRRDITDIINDTKSVLIEKMGSNLFNENSARIIFAICVDSIETWICQLIFDDIRISNAEDFLGYKVRKLDHPRIGYAKTSSIYSKMMKMVKKKRVKSLVGHPSSLGQFLKDAVHIHASL